MSPKPPVGSHNSTLSETRSEVRVEITPDGRVCRVLRVAFAGDGPRPRRVLEPELVEALRQAKVDCDPRVRRALDVVLAYAGGVPVRVIRTHYDCAESSVHRLVALAAAGGAAALLAHKARRLRGTNLRAG